MDSSKFMNCAKQDFAKMGQNVQKQVMDIIKLRVRGTEYYVDEAAGVVVCVCDIRSELGCITFTVKAKATCFKGDKNTPADIFDAEVGKRIAYRRCQMKITKIRRQLWELAMDHMYNPKEILSSQGRIRYEGKGFVTYTTDKSITDCQEVLDLIAAGKISNLKMPVQ